MCTIKKCPVPFDQQPLNEYKALKSSWFFNWSTIETFAYISQVLYLFLFFSVLVLPVSINIVPKSINSLKGLLLSLIISSIIILFIFIRLYLGWSYIIKRLISSTIFYEESGWYDGQIWIKSIESLTQDRLVGFYEVAPFVKRVKYSLLTFISILIANTLLYSLI